MRLLVRSYRFPGADFDDVLDATHGEATIRQIYGPATTIGAWSARGERRIQLRLPKPEGLDVALRSLRGKTFVGAALKQRVERDEKQRLHEVRGSIRLKLLGAELIKIRPSTVVSRMLDSAAFVHESSYMPSDAVEVRTTVELHAVLPPPFDRVVEGVMAMQAEEDMARFAEVLARAVEDKTRRRLAVQKNAVQSGGTSPPQYCPCWTL